MSWGIISGDERMIPTGNFNEIKFESGKPKRIRLLLAEGEEPYSFFQHAIENEVVQNGQTERIYRTVNCLKTKDNPFAHCPLCEGQQIRRRIRHAAPAWDYEEGKAGILVGGGQIWEPIATYHKMGIDVSTLDLVISKSGKTRNDTKYSVANMGQSNFQLPEGTEIPNPRDEFKPHSVEEMKGLIETCGLYWDEVIVPPAIPYPETLQEALNHEMPNTKYKGQKMGDIYETNKSMIEFLANSNRVSIEKGCAQVILVALAGANIEGVPRKFYQGGKPVSNVSANNPTTPGPQTDCKTATQPSTSAKQDKINKINELLQTKKTFKEGGYNKIVETMQKAGNGKSQITEFTDAELDAMLKLCEDAE